MIESTQNKMVKKLISLKTRKTREKEGVFLAEGQRFVSEIPAEWDVKFYAISESYAKVCHQDVLEAKAKVFIFSDAIFQTISDTTHPQGILAVCAQKKISWQQVLSQNSQGFYLLAEELNDPGNLGTILRTADACGVQGVFLSKGSVDLYNPKVLRSTMGSIFHLPIVQNVDLKEILEQMKQKKVMVLAAHLQGKQYLYQYDLCSPCAFVIGNEARGLSDEIAGCCSDFVKIPMIGQAESLNASMAAGVLMYEVVRQRITRAE